MIDLKCTDESMKLSCAVFNTEKCQLAYINVFGVGSDGEQIEEFVGSFEITREDLKGFAEQILNKLERLERGTAY